MAVKELSQRLSGKIEELYKVLGSKGPDHLCQGAKIDIDKHKLKALIAEVMQVAEEMPLKQREMVVDPLEQRDISSRLRYLNKLLRKSGANLNLNLAVQA